MQVSVSVRGPVGVLNVQGPLVEEDVSKLDIEADKLRNTGIKKMVLDLRDAPFVDSAGLEKIQSLSFDLGRSGGDLRVATLNDVCRDIFMCTRVESFVQVFEDREAAIHSLL